MSYFDALEQAAELVLRELRLEAGASARVARFRALFC